MKITVDTEKKEITLVENAKLKDVVEFMKAIYPDSWKEYSFVLNKELIWYYYPQTYYTYYPQYKYAVNTTDTGKYQYEVVNIS